jgi:hypothetical protein
MSEDFPLDTLEQVRAYRAEMEREPTPDEWPDIRARQLEFLKIFGDFDFDESRIFDGVWVGSSPDGRHIGFYFNHSDGTEVRVALATQLMLALGKNLSIATRISAERARAAFQTAGRA